MKANLQPFNLDLLIPKAEDLRGVPEIQVLDIFDGFSRNFHPNGLFSVEKFGKIGEERRSRTFGYVDLHVPVLHPVLFKTLSNLKGLYEDIMAGRSYAKFDEASSDFVKSEIGAGQTGYSFFMKHFDELKFEERPSSKREFAIKLINKYRKNHSFDTLIIMPAGLRDYTMDDNGKPSEDELNLLYRKVMSAASIIQNINAKINAEYLDNARYNLQVGVNNIYSYITNLLEGKNKLILGKWAARKVFQSTRNVITSYLPVNDELNGPRTVRPDQTVVGLNQYLRSTFDISIKSIRDTYLPEVFPGPNSPAVLVNKKTLKKEIVQLDPQYFDDFNSTEGLEGLLATYAEEALRHEPIEIEGYYLGLMYNDGKYFKFVQDKEDLPDGFKEEHLKPITYAELLYTSVFREAPKIPGFVTRYPITGYGSVYPSYMYLKSTINSHILEELDANWQPSGVVAEEFPVAGDQFYNSMSPAVQHLPGLGADFDGDLCSLICLMLDESHDEIRELMSSRNFYVGVNGKMPFSAANDVIDLVMVNTTG